MMPLASHLSQLEKKHGELDQEIAEAMGHPSTDDLQLVTLKRRKLALKDEIEKLRSEETQH